MKKILLVTDTWIPQVNGVVTTWVNLKNLFIDKELIVKTYSYNDLYPFWQSIRLLNRSGQTLHQFALGGPSGRIPHACGKSSRPQNRRK